MSRDRKPKAAAFSSSFYLDLEQPVVTVDPRVLWRLLVLERRAASRGGCWAFCRTGFSPQ